MFSKISNMLGNAWDFGKSLMKPFKNHISNGWEALKNGASKVGQFVNNNHEAIGSILSGVGNIIGNLPNSPLKQKLQNFGNTATDAGNMFSNGFNRPSNMARPQNTQRTQFNNNLNNRTIGHQGTFQKPMPNAGPQRPMPNTQGSTPLAGGATLMKSGIPRRII